jgi:hypothetical protein
VSESDSRQPMIAAGCCKYGSQSFPCFEKLPQWIFWR